MVFKAAELLQKKLFSTALRTLERTRFLLVRLRLLLLSFFLLLNTIFLFYFHQALFFFLFLFACGVSSSRLYACDDITCVFVMCTPLQPRTPLYHSLSFDYYICSRFSSTVLTNQHDKKRSACLPYIYIYIYIYICVSSFFSAFSLFDTLKGKFLYSLIKQESCSTLPTKSVCVFFSPPFFFFTVIADCHLPFFLNILCCSKSVFLYFVFIVLYYVELFNTSVEASFSPFLFLLLFVCCLCAFLLKVSVNICEAAHIQSCFTYLFFFFSLSPTFVSGSDSFSIWLFLSFPGSFILLSFLPFFFPAFFFFCSQVQQKA